MLESAKFKRPQNAKCFVYFLAFIVLQVAVILIFSLTIMRVKTPSLRLSSVHIQSLNFNDNTTSPHFDMTLVAEISVRNKNFGNFRFDNATAIVTYGGVRVGDGEIVGGRARARSTTRLNVTIEVSSNERAVLQSMGKVNLTMASVAKLSGKVTLMKVIKKKKTAHMNCTMAVHLSTRSVPDLHCP